MKHAVDHSAELRWCCVSENTTRTPVRLQGARAKKGNLRQSKTRKTNASRDINMSGPRQRRVRVEPADQVIEKTQSTRISRVEEQCSSQERCKSSTPDHTHRG